MAALAADVRVLGVRHHGPGSARTVERALDELRPDRLLIEGAPELDALLPVLGRDDLVPPVAALVYAPDQPRRAAFYPLAAFSPEWVAARWALTHDVPVGFADLAAAIGLVDPEEEPREPGPDRHPDPIAELAAAAGVNDPERWWEDAVEHRGASALEAFADIAAAMREVRSGHEPDEELLRREASMRLGLRRAIAAGATRLAVVCGAYHAPALDPAGFPTKREDEARLAGLPKVKVAVTVAPWTSQRLAAESGYGAGVRSPGWYAHLFRSGDDPVPEWMVRAARALRDAGIPASPAAAVEAARLADTLAALRGRPSTGLEEVTDATLAVLCEGSSVPLQLVERELVIGSELGEVPPDVPLVPLAADLAAQQRRLRFKPGAAQTTLELDLRREGPAARSVLLHRLRLLDVHWGVPAAGRSTTGTFAEAWVLQWQPAFSVALVVASALGTTIADAAGAALAQQAESAADLGALSALVESALVADLPDGLDAVVRALADRTAQQGDVRELLSTVEPLARVQRYGSVRGTPTGDVEQLLAGVVVRAAVGLRGACTSLDDEGAAEMRSALEGAERGVRLVGLPDAEWIAGVRAAAGDERVHGAVAGRAVRMLFDRGLLTGEAVATTMSRRLSAAGSATDGAAWLDGFLAGDAQVLLHDDALRGLVDAWITEVADAVFDDVLPLVRRTFAAFPPPERRLLGERLRSPGAPGRRAEVDVDLARGLPAARRLAGLIGLEVPA